MTAIDGGTDDDLIHGEVRQRHAAAADRAPTRSIFDTALDKSTNVDAILDFEIGVDTIALSDEIFGAIGCNPGER